MNILLVFVYFTSLLVLKYLHRIIFIYFKGYKPYDYFIKCNLFVLFIGALIFVFSLSNEMLFAYMIYCLFVIIDIFKFRRRFKNE